MNLVHRHRRGQGSRPFFTGLSLATAYKKELCHDTFAVFRTKLYTPSQFFNCSVNGLSRYFVPLKNIIGNSKLMMKFVY